MSLIGEPVQQRQISLGASERVGRFSSTNRSWCENSSPNA